MPYNTPTQPHFIGGMVYPLVEGAIATPPVPCEFALGDSVTFVNDFGVAFHHLTITGFDPKPEHGRFVFLDQSAWWFGARTQNLVKTSEEEKVRYAALKQILENFRDELRMKRRANPDDEDARLVLIDVEDALTARDTRLMESVAEGHGALLGTHEKAEDGVPVVTRPRG